MRDKKETYETTHYIIRITGKNKNDQENEEKEISRVIRKKNEKEEENINKTRRTLEEKQQNKKRKYNGKQKETNAKT